MSTRRPFNDDFPELEIEDGDPNAGDYGCKLWIGDQLIYERSRSIPTPDGYTAAILKAGAAIAVNRFNLLLAELGSFGAALDKLTAELEAKKETDATEQG